MQSAQSPRYFLRPIYSVRWPEITNWQSSELFVKEPKKPNGENLLRVVNGY